jgi:hypothetical protein
MWTMMMMTAMGGNYEILEGTRPARQLNEAVNVRQKSMATCFGGRTEAAKFHVTVGADGRVSDAKYSMDGITDKEVLQCLFSEALQLRLVPNQDPAPTTYVWMASLASIAEEPPRAAPKPGELWIDGPHTEVAIREVLKRNEVQYDFCKRKARTLDVPVPKAITVHFRIDPQGEVHEARVEGREADAFTDCMTSRIAGLDFGKPPSPGQTDVVFPIAISD